MIQVSPRMRFSAQLLHQALKDFSAMLCERVLNTAEHGLTGTATPPMQTWTGEWPGVAECREWGWYARWTLVTAYSRYGRPDSGPEECCGPDNPDAHEDLNRLALAAATGEVVWNRERERYERPADRPELPEDEA